MRTCQSLYAIATRAVHETGVDASVERVEDIEKIVACNVLHDAGPGDRRPRQDGGARPEPG